MRPKLSAACLLGLALAGASAVAQDSAEKSFAPDQIKKGAEVYARNCSTCHGARLANPEWAVDLRNFPRGDHARFIDTVTHGVRSMPSWGDVIKPDDVEALWAYVVAGERK